MKQTDFRICGFRRFTLIELLDKGRPALSLGRKFALIELLDKRRPALSLGRKFTLIELLVVIAIIAILAAMLLPALSRAKEQGRRVACLGNLQQRGIMAMSHAADFDGYVPRAYGSKHTNPGFASPFDMPHQGSNTYVFGGDWLAHGTPWETWEEYGILESTVTCPSSPGKTPVLTRYTKSNAGGWDPSPLRTWHYLYVAGTSSTSRKSDSSRLNWGTSGTFAPVDHRRLSGQPDPVNQLMAADQIHAWIGGAATVATNPTISHANPNGLGAAYQSHLFGDGHVKGYRHSSLNTLTTDTNQYALKDVLPGGNRYWYWAGN